MVVASTQKEKVIVNHNFILKDFEVKFLTENVFHSLGNHDFWNLSSF